MTTVPNNSGEGSYLVRAEPFTNSGSYEQMITIKTRQIGRRLLRIRGTVAGSALTGLKVTKLITPGQSHSDYFVDAGLSQPMNMLPWTSYSTAGNLVHLTSADSAFEFVIDTLGLDEIAVWAKSAGNGTITFEVA